MGYTAYLQALLRPLGVYALQKQTLSGGELFALGESLDALWQSEQTALREAIPATAQDEGIASYASLFGILPDDEDAANNRERICALLRIGSGGASAQALEDTLRACGVPVTLQETETVNTVRVIFPTLLSQPDNFAQMRQAIESILPCHLAIEYAYHCITWQAVATADWTWNDFCVDSWKLLLSAEP